jgi:hypothetical protein|tara:strand:+ start:353 stop:550 length:198 start_codon:yes stop_codon:yes gene_type:complete
MSSKLRSFEIVVRSPKSGGFHTQTLKVDGAGVGKISARLSAMRQLRSSFPIKEGHEFIGIKEVHK